MTKRQTTRLILLHVSLLLVPKAIMKEDAPPGRNGSLLSSHASIYAHVNWGLPEDRVYKNTTDPKKRKYVGYGRCPSRWPIYYYRHILDAGELQLIIHSYAEMFRMSCDSNFITNLRDLFEKGYARLETDHSVDFSWHTILFIKPHMSFQDLDDLESLLVFSAFSQTYVSWIRFPVNPLDPLGNQIPDNCFIEIVARLHVLDLIIAVARRYKDRIAFEMGVKLKHVLNGMRLEYSTIKGNDPIMVSKRKIAKQCLVVTMALMEFFFTMADMGLRKTCSHTAFKEFYTRKEKAYQIEAEKYGRVH